MKKGAYARFPDARFTLWLRLAVDGERFALGGLHEEHEDAAIVCVK